MIILKVFRVIGEINKPNLETSFNKEVIAEKKEHAIEKVYAELGSKHRVKRFQIKLISIEEVPVENIEDLLLKKLITGED